MPRVDFYIITKSQFLENPMLLVCKLVRKGYEANQACLILARSRTQAQILDDLLWAFDPDIYLPHQIVDTEEDDAITPILIAAPEHATTSRPLVINLRDQAAQGHCDRILEVVVAHPESRQLVRARWRAYRSQGWDVSKHDI